MPTKEKSKPKTTKAKPNPKATLPPSNGESANATGDVATHGEDQLASVAPLVGGKTAKKKAANSPLPKDTTDYNDATYYRIAETLKQVSDKTRVQVIMTLSTANSNVGDMCKFIGSSQPALSHHLALLRHGGIVFPIRSGKHNYYELTAKGRILAASVKKLADQSD